MRLNDAEQAKYEALADAIWLCLKPIVDEIAQIPYQPGVLIERALDRATLALMKLVDDAYKQGRNDENAEWREVEWAHFEQ